MQRVCKTAKDFADSIKNNDDTIIIEGDLRKGVLRIKAIGPIAWGVCAVSLAIAIALLLTAPTATVVATPVGGAALAAHGVIASSAAAATLGSAVVPAVAIGVCSGGIGALNTLRDKYKIVEKNNKYIKLKRK